jgi:hypothetical protein
MSALNCLMCGGKYGHHDTRCPEIAPLSAKDASVPQQGESIDTDDFQALLAQIWSASAGKETCDAIDAMVAYIHAWRDRSLAAARTAAPAQVITVSDADFDHIAAELEKPAKVNEKLLAKLQAAPAQDVAPSYTYASTQATKCAGCLQHKHTPLRIDSMGGYVCLTCIDRKLGALLGEFGYPQDVAPSELPEYLTISQVGIGVSAAAYVEGWNKSLDACRAALAAKAGNVAVPDGHVVVPTTLTPEMRKAGVKLRMSQNTSIDGVYAAILAAAMHPAATDAAADGKAGA